MTSKEREILNIIKNDPTIEQSAIAELLNISRNTVGVHISSLQKQGYLLGKGYIVKDDDYIVGIGASNVDIYCKSRIKIRTHYDHPADITTSLGGVCRNVIQNYTLLGGKARFITAYSDDPYGNMIRDDCRNRHIDIDDALFIKNCSSGVFVQIQDEHNDMYLATCDMSILQNVTPEFVKEKEKIILGSKLLVIDPSLPQETIEELIRMCKGKVRIFIDPISDNYAQKIRPYARDFAFIKPNRTEMENLCGRELKSDKDLKKACEEIIASGTGSLLVSLGKEGVVYCDSDNYIKRKFREEKMVNASGAGDALMAAMIYGAVNELEIDQTIDYALAAGIAAVRSPKTINENLSIALLDEIIEENKK